MISSRVVKAAAMSVIFPLYQLSAAHAGDASFACKVLLCSAATNPSWSSIPYCVPIMQQAIYMQAWGIAIGICAEAQRGASDGDGSDGLGGRLNTQ